MTAAPDTAPPGPVPAGPGGGQRRLPWGGGPRKPPRQPGELPRWAQHPEPAGPVREAIGTMFVILAALLIGFAAWIAIGSRLYFDRVQYEAYESFRVPLANGDAPTGPYDPLHQSKLVPLGTPVALLEIPALHMKDVVLEGTTGQVLEGGPGHVRDSPLPGQQGVSVILGRRAAYGGPFAGLGSLAPGDAINVVTQEGVASYKVTDLRRAGSPLPPPLAAGSGRLVLVTADGSPLFPAGEVYVDADLAGQPFVTVAPAFTASTLPPAENAMGTDSAAWVPLVFWGQLLLLAGVAVSWLSRAWGRWQTWLVAVPVLAYLCIVVSDEVTRLLPNIL